MVEAAPPRGDIAAQEQVTERARNKIDEFRAYKTEFLSKINALEPFITQNTQSEQNPNGLLAINAPQLLECLRMTTTKFRELLRQEEAQWAQNYLLTLLPPEPKDKPKDKPIVKPIVEPIVEVQ